MNQRSLKHVTQSDFARQLLVSADADASAPGAMQRALAGLGFAPVGLLGATVVTTISTSAAGANLGSSSLVVASKLGVLTIGKWLGVGLFGGIAAMAALDLAVGSTAAQPQPTAGPARAAVPAEAAPPAHVERAAEIATVTVPSPSEAWQPRDTAATRSAERVAEDDVHAPLGSAPSAGSFETTPGTSSDDMTQLTALTAIRRALAAHQAAAALALLDDFSRRYPASKLSEEASVLRIEALRELGRAHEASSLGNRFLREHPHSVYAARVRVAAEIP